MSRSSAMRPVPVAFRVFLGCSAERPPTVFLACSGPEGAKQPERSERLKNRPFSAERPVTLERNASERPRNGRGTQAFSSIVEVRHAIA